MSYVRKNSAKIVASILGIIAVLALSMWQFHLFVTFKDRSGILDTQGGTNHLWWAIAMALFACLTGFFVFSVFVQHDTVDDLHITS
jgi:H+/Cl- antiporter ClcA